MEEKNLNNQEEKQEETFLIKYLREANEEWKKGHFVMTNFYPTDEPICKNKIFINNTKKFVKEN